MAKQKSIIRLRGTLGGITFYKSKDGYLARESGGVSAERFRNDPRFKRSRENCSEFGTAGKGAKLLRQSLRSLIMQASDSRVSNRLSSLLLKVVQSDPENERGLRRIEEGNLSLLRGFEFNRQGKLDSSFYGSYESSIDRATGEAQISLSAFTAEEVVVAPEGTTHFKLMSGISAVDFKLETFASDFSYSEILPWDQSLVPAMTLETSLSSMGGLPIFHVFGILFYQEVNGAMYPLKNSVYNALRLIGVDQESST